MTCLELTRGVRGSKEGTRLEYKTLLLWTNVSNKSLMPTWYHMHRVESCVTLHTYELYDVGVNLFFMLCENKLVVVLLCNWMNVVVVHVYI